ncbi:efflux RND transporter periplasmic adaptor subunit [Bdellovibrio sp. 22V]|uniref:efflux RND transporter periplasmic adaptor subunit n=1 Tax=Bdellovibrio TaxID=958 RepID=UPI0025431CE0|nr:efflux RND transporter periplasmic adaptor subunit [Bdellovibrio sp. 22V]WII70932.1 efflux RND transporter periplasmic adaptor subunit [Bdellovibrio sp. 22V]
MSKKKILPLVILVVLLLAAYLVKVFLFRNDFSYAGTVEVTKVDIPARVTSVINEFPVKEGQVVAKGQDLVKLACEDIRLAYDLLKKNYSRSSRLMNAGGIPREAYDRVQNQKAEAELRVSWCDIKAPLKGTILTTYFEPGEMVNPGSKLLTMGDLEEVYAYFYLPHDEIAPLKLRQKVQATLPEMDDKTFEGVISYINPEAEFTPKNVQTRDERTRLVYAVKVYFQNPEGVLKPGMTLEWKGE